MSERLRVAFMGSPEFAVPCLEALHGRVDLRLVVSQPDQPAGRGLSLLPTAVKRRALELGLPVDQPASLRKPEPYAPRLAGLDLDLIVVVAYGKILPPDLLAVPRHGCWNVHGSLLPRHRGAAPFQWSILSGDRQTGVTLMQMDAGMDTGPILLQRPSPLDDCETCGGLLCRMAEEGAAVLVDGLERLAAGTLTATPQDAALATMAPTLEKEHGRIDWSASDRAIHCRIRAVDPWPGAFTLLDGQPLKVWCPRRVAGGGPPGTVIESGKAGFVVACGEGALSLGELQLPGRKRMAAAALLSGRPIPVGTVLGR